MSWSSLIERVRRGTHRILFWLPGAAPHNEEQPEHLHDHHLVLSVIAPTPVPRWRQLRYLFRVLSLKEQRVFFITSACAGLALAALGFRFVISRVISVPVVGGSFTEALVGQPKSLNPLDASLNNVDQDIVRLVYSGLFRFNELEAVPDLAESYSWSDDHKTLTLQLRKDARFHDGEPVTANDVQFTIESLQQPERKSSLRTAFRGVKLNLQDDTTIAFTLDHPDPFFTQKLTVGILPEHLWQNVSVANSRLSDLNTRPIGSGPYRIKSFSRDSLGNIHSYTLERFDQYYGDKPYLKNVTFQFFSDRQEALDAFKGDLVDAIAPFFAPASDSQTFQSSNRIHALPLELPEETVAFFNLKDKTLSSQTVRSALSFAVQRDEVLNSIHGAGVILNSPFPFGFSTSTALNLETARQLLTDAGWILPENGDIRIWSPPKTKTAAKKPTTSTTAASSSTTPVTELELTISVAQEADLIAMAETLKRQWSLIGARVTIEALPTDELTRRATRERKTQIVLVNILLTADQNIFPFWWSGQAADQGKNISSLVDRPVDDSLEQIKNATSTEALNRAMQTAADRIQHLTPAVFLLRPFHTYLISGQITVPDTHAIIASPAERLSGILHWYRKTGWRIK